jgi:hypothetical protein
MTVVIDASLLVSLAANDPRAEAVDTSPLGLPIRLAAT